MSSSENFMSFMELMNDNVNKCCTNVCVNRKYSTLNIQELCQLRTLRSPSSVFLVLAVALLLFGVVILA